MNLYKRVPTPRGLLRGEDGRSFGLRQAPRKALRLRHERAWRSAASLVVILGFWASFFPGREPGHFVFSAERYGASGNGLTVVYDIDPTKPIGRWKHGNPQKFARVFPVDFTT